MSLMASAPIEDCWKRTGVFGDKSCPRLPARVHCRNCEAHAESAIRMLERFSAEPSEQFDEPVNDAEPGDLRSTLLFRLGKDWCGLATRSLLEVMPQRPVHALPHARSGALLGLCNVHGALVACISLSVLLGLEASSGGGPALPRMLVLSSPGGPIVVPVDEIGGIHALPLAALQAPRGDSRVSHLTQGLMQWQQRSITVLDGERLRSAMVRSLT